MKHQTPLLGESLRMDIQTNIQMAKLYGKNLKVTFKLIVNAKSTAKLNPRPTSRTDQFVVIPHFDMEDTDAACNLVLDELQSNLIGACLSLGATKHQLDTPSKHFNICNRLKYDMIDI